MIMNEDTDLRKLEQLTFRVANQDGLTEILMGLMLMAIGLLLIRSIFVVYVSLLIVFQTIAIERFREKYTYPRIGRVKFKEEQETDYGPLWGVFALIIFVALASVIASIVIQNEIIEIVARWAPLIMSVGLLQPFSFLVQRTGLKRYYGVEAIITLLSVVLVLLEFSLASERMVIYLLVVGGSLFLAGLIGLGLFIRKYPVLDVEDVGYEQDQ